MQTASVKSLQYYKKEGIFWVVEESNLKLK